MNLPNQSLDGRVAHSFALLANDWGSRGLDIFPVPVFYRKRPFPKVDSNLTRLAVGVGTKAAPCPLIRFAR